MSKKNGGKLLKSLHRFFTHYQSICCLSSRLCDQLFYLFVQAFGFHQLFQRQVHTPAPVVARIGRYIDTFFLRIGVAPFAVHRHPVLQGEDGKYGIALQVQSNSDRKSTRLNSSH